MTHKYKFFAIKSKKNVILWNDLWNCLLWLDCFFLLLLYFQYFMFIYFTLGYLTCVIWLFGLGIWWCCFFNSPQYAVLLLCGFIIMSFRFYAVWLLCGFHYYAVWLLCGFTIMWFDHYVVLHVFFFIRTKFIRTIRLKFGQKLRTS